MIIELTAKNINDYSFPDILSTKSITTPKSIEIYFEEYFYIDKFIESPCILKIVFAPNTTRSVLLHDDKWHPFEVLEDYYIDLVMEMSINENGEFEMYASMPLKSGFVLKSTHTTVYLEVLGNSSES